MRKPSAYEKYMNRMFNYYRTRQEEIPQWLHDAAWFRQLYLDHFRFFRAPSIQTIEKMWNIFNMIPVNYSSSDDLFPGLYDSFKQVHDILFELYRIFILDKDPLYVTGKMISKPGGEKIKELVGQLRKLSIYGIPIPDNRFTNMPSKIIFSRLDINRQLENPEEEIDIQVFSELYFRDGNMRGPIPYKMFPMKPDLMDKLIQLLQ